MDRMDREEFQRAFEAVYWPGDGQDRKARLQLGAHAYAKYLIASELRPCSVVEIGVRAGYSGWALCLGAGTTPSYYGIDSLGGLHGGTTDKRAWAHAKGIVSLVAHGVTMLQASSHDVKALGPADLYHVDGDHSVEGALADVELCWAARSDRSTILVDDYDWEPMVRDAVVKFLQKTDCRWTYRPSLRGELLIASSSGAELGLAAPTEWRGGGPR